MIDIDKREKELRLEFGVIGSPIKDGDTEKKVLHAINAVPAVCIPELEEAIEAVRNFTAHQAIVKILILEIDLDKERHEGQVFLEKLRTINSALEGACGE